jgi:hypothetical protein
LARRYGEPFYGSKYLGIKDKLIVHDMDYESNMCRINELLEKFKVIPFTPDSIDQAYTEGYDNCGWCIGGGMKY